MMDKQEAEAIYDAGKDAVVEALCRLSARIDELEKQHQGLSEKIAALSKDSSTSHKPPSSDVTKKPKTRAFIKPLPISEKKKKGGQPGHPKHNREAFSPDEVDHRQNYGLIDCPHCASDDIVLLPDPPRVVQQIKLKPIRFEVTEHRTYPFYCGHCEAVHYATFPDEVVKAGLFDAELTALVAYMKHVCHASFSTLRKFLRDVIGIRVSRGYLAKCIQKVSDALDQPYVELLNRLPLETTLNVDETGHKDNRLRFWTWVFRAELYVLFRIDKSRGSQVLIDVLGKEFDGVLGCDYFSAYRKYMKDCDVTVQFCLAHLIRDIRYLTTLPDPDTKAYGERVLEGVRQLFKVIHERETQSDEVFKLALETAKTELSAIVLETVPSELDAQGKELKNKAQNLATRFRDHGEAYFQFITTPGIDPTNNLAEQAIRFIVIDRYVTQGTRSDRGRTASERIWTVIATCAMQGRSAFEFIRQAVHTNWHNEPPPSLLPDTG